MHTWTICYIHLVYISNMTSISLFQWCLFIISLSRRSKLYHFFKMCWVKFLVLLVIIDDFPPYLLCCLCMKSVFWLPLWHHFLYFRCVMWGKILQGWRLLKNKPGLFFKVRGFAPTVNLGSEINLFRIGQFEESAFSQHKLIHFHICR